MIEVGLLALIAGMLAGYISLRSMGWLCVVGISLMCLEVRATQTVNISVYNGSGGDMVGNIQELYGTWGQFAVVSSTPAGQTYYGSFQTCAGAGPLQYRYRDNTGNLGSQAEYTVGCSGTLNMSFYYGAPAAPQYIFNGACITNDSTQIVGFYGHLSQSVGGSQDYYSGPLPPKGWWCMPALTNSSPFTLEWIKVYYNSDGGTNAVDVFPPINAGTNAPPPVQGGSAPGGPPNGSNPIGPGSGVGSNTNLTGGQFGNGMSNLINVNVDVGNAIIGALHGINLTLGSNANNQIDYRSYLITLTNQGEGHLTTARVLTNYAGQLYTQIVQVAAISQTNFHWMSNNLDHLGDLVSTNRWGTNQSYGGLFDAVSTNASAASNTVAGVLFGPGTSGEMFGNGSNYVSGSGSLSFWELPIYTDVGHTTHWNMDFTSKAIWTQVCPWIRLVFTWLLTIFAVKYIDWRVTTVMEGSMFVERSGAVAKGPLGVLGALLGQATIAIALAAAPVILSAAVSSVYTMVGGAPVSPLSDTGAAAAGSYSPSIVNGFKVLTDVFPYVFGISLMGYLAFFDKIVTGFTQFAYRLIWGAT